MAEDIYRVLFVCSGNICRSPFAERLLRTRLDERLGTEGKRIEVASSGTWGLVGHQMMAESAQTLARYGGVADGFEARELTPAQIESADLVLGLAREHRSAVVTMLPRAHSRAMTLREYARLLADVTPADLAAPGDDPVARFRAITATAFSRRGLVPPEDAADNDVPDPFGGKMPGYELAARLIDTSLAVPLALLAP